MMRRVLVTPVAKQVMGAAAGIIKLPVLMMSNRHRIQHVWMRVFGMAGSGNSSDFNNNGTFVSFLK
jgi:hypothetical protein